MSNILEKTVSQATKAHTEIGRIEIGLFNRVIINDFLLYDQKGDTLLYASKLSASVDLVPLLKGRLSFSAAQLFNPLINLSRDDESAPLNCQFVFDALKSDSSKESRTPDISIRSLIIRRGQFRYNLLSTPPTSSSPFDHISLHNLSAHLMFDMHPETTDLYLKRLSFSQTAAPSLKALSFRMKATGRNIDINRLSLKLNQSDITLDARARLSKNDSTGNTLQDINITSLDATIVPSELSYYARGAQYFNHPVNIKADHLKYEGKTFLADNLQARMNGMLTGSLTGSINSSAADTTGLSFQLHTTQEFYHHLQEAGVAIPEVFRNVAYLDGKGMIDYRDADKYAAITGLFTSDLGEFHVNYTDRDGKGEGTLKTGAFNVGKLAGNDNLGFISAEMAMTASHTGTSLTEAAGTFKVGKLEYKGYPYSAITGDAKYNAALSNQLSVNLTVNDPNIRGFADGTLSTDGSAPSTARLQIDEMRPADIHLTDRLGPSSVSFNVTADISKLTTAKGYPYGTVMLSDFVLRQETDSLQPAYYYLHRMRTTADAERITLAGDFGQAELKGHFDMSTIASSVSTLIARHLPTLPWPDSKETTTVRPDNAFTLQAFINDTRWLNKVFGIPVNVYQPATLQATVNDRQSEYKADITLPSFTYNGSYYEDAEMHLWQEKTDSDMLKAEAIIKRINNEGQPQQWELQAEAADNHLKADVAFTDNGQRALHGELHTDTRFYVDSEGNNEAQTTVHPSVITIDETKWFIQPADIVYSKNRLVFDHLSIENGQQHISINGVGTDNTADSISVSLQGVDVAYILDLVDFHSVDFAGTASGRAVVSALFGEPQAEAFLTVDDFLFESGRMGTLQAHASVNQTDQQIDIDAVSKDIDGHTVIRGYVSPWRNDMDLFIEAHDTRLEFVEGFCSSFMSNVMARASGWTRVAGDLKHINLEGDMVASGPLTITPLNTTYYLNNDTIKLVPNEILFHSDTVYQSPVKAGEHVSSHYAVVNGAVHHRELKDISYDIDIMARNMLVADLPLDEVSFAVTAFASGQCTISGNDDRCMIEAELTPEQGSVVSYNAASPEAINSQEFVKWKTPTPTWDDDHGNTTGRRTGLSAGVASTSFEPSASDLHMNLIIHANPSACLRIIMDNSTGDDITLFGNGTLRAQYHNNGAFNLYGNYIVDHGTYKLTIQNVIKKDFQFLAGSSLAFRGEPYEATLELNARYTVNGVPLSDLQLGRSFTSNNIRVDCKMNISGTPLAPHVDFSFDLPTIGNDAKQMIYSLINSEEEMNQQVLYLLAIGRFYGQQNNNADAASQQSQASLAMQSILSGTISQQINNLLSSMVNNRNWNFGASITTGDEGFYNAEYEGLLQGRLLNNRLIFDGQFGYRDNANATSSFIGDFDLRYLLTPNGNVSVRVYNQTNDRYFTRNSLTTQGLGIILKKDFQSLRDLFSK